jgi:succinate dehydrogenase / fumarate reductase cytochrome b subunit
MARNPSRPLSPHLTAYKWGPHMVVSILHRITGAGLTFVGGIALVWWLFAAATSPEAYADFEKIAASKWTLIIWIPLSWALIEHVLSGLRHLVMDIGAGFEISQNKRWALATLVGSILLTAALWAYIVAVR